MPRQPGPRTEREWEDWHRAQKGLPPLPTDAELKAKDAERKRKDANRNRVARQRDPNKRMKQPAPKVKLAPVVDLKTKAAQPDKASQTTHVKTPATDPPEPKTMGRNEIAWTEQTKDYAQDNPALVATILTLASVLDDLDRSAMWPTTSRQIQSYYVQLTGGKRKTKSRGKLQIVQRMTGTRRAAQ